MVIIRPVRESDLDQIVALAGMAGFGLTSLPKDRGLLEERIEESVRSLQYPPKRPGGELYIFVMEDPATGNVVGTSCILSKVGGFEPFYAFRVESSIHQSIHLNFRKEIAILNLVTEHSGPCEVGGLYLSPDYRKHGNGRLLSLHRFLFMAEYPQRFEPIVIAEMRGVVDADGRSPFWDALGSHFFDMDFPRADILSCGDKRFIADLMPKCPVYIPLLPKEAQEVVGKVHPNTEPALKMLIDEGFRYSGMVDIFEAGPVILARMEDIRMVRESKSAVVEEISSKEIESRFFVVARVDGQYRACSGHVRETTAGGVVVEEGVAEALGVGPGERIRFGPLKPVRA